MTNFSKLFRPALVLAIVAPAFGQHGSTRDFDNLTARWYQVSRTPVPLAEARFAITPDDRTIFVERMQNGELGIAKIDCESGRELGFTKPGIDWQDLGCDAEGNLLLKSGEAWKAFREGSWVDAEAPRRGRESSGERRRGRVERDGVPRGHADWKSPDGKHRLEVQDGALVLVSGEKRQTVIPAAAGQVFRDTPLWAPDSTRFAIWRTRDVAEHQLHFIESSPADQLQPKHRVRAYPKPGQEIDTRAPWVGFTDGREVLAPDESLIAHPFDCRNLMWRPDGRRLTFEFIERGFGKHRVIGIDTEKRTQAAIIDESSDTFIYVYGNSERRDLRGGDEILWLSERDGWNHLYLHDGNTSRTIRQLTRGPWVVRGLERVDEENREVMVRVSGFHRDQDPYFIHYLRVGLDDGKIIPLTTSDGTHEFLRRSPGGNYYVCRHSRVDSPPVTELRRWRDGSLVSVLATGDDRALKAAGWKMPIPFTAPDREGKFDIHGIICLPPDFDPAKKYPVVEYIYAGPQDAFVPKKWTPWRMPMHELAVHGFILVQIDGRGTNHRGREFSHFSYKNLADGGFPDRIAWMRAAAAKFPQMDLARVGIFGGSAGGQNALAGLLFHPDFYKAGAADCGCHDNRMDKIWWNEQWMDWPMGDHYAEQSNVTNIAKLRGALFLTVGELDDNVDPSSTYQVINALIREDKDFEFILMTGRGHGSGEERYAQRRRMDFFRRHLGGPEVR
ncbi:MAG: prolyl oligopeptidase family serine peptidase [Akkermansiaceae bacterium]|jgi:dipeptidyl aminopeptidase/acylaminoacyl peptidase|nr:prolyl oligopeptidase family serine peptidase [Akkermansiaceae bacterium]